MSVKHCCLCLTTTLHTVSDPHCEIHGKLVCLGCRDQLLAMPLPQSQLLLPAPTSPIAIYLEATTFAVCPQHDLALAYVSDDCEEPACELCISDHPERAYQDLVPTTEARLRDLHIVEYLGRYVMLQRLDGNAEALVGEIVAFYETVKHKSPFETYLRLSHVIGSFWGRIQDLYPAFRGFTPLQAIASLPLRQEQRQSSAQLHWAYWGSNSIYFLDIETRKSQKLPLGADFKIPLFSRTVLLADGNIFVCGGRTEASGMSLKTCWLLPHHSDSQITPLPDLLYGRSNHWALLHSSHIYVIAGCDQNNKFTNKCERFSLTTQTWQMIAGTNETRDSVSAVADTRFDCIYTAGGRIDNGVLARSVERYDVGRNMWVLLGVRLPFAGSMLGVALLPGTGTRLLVFGGLTAANQATKRAVLVDINRETVLEIGEMKGDGGCIVDMPLVYGGSVYALVFSGIAARTWEKWSIEYEEWEALPSNSAN